MSSGYWRTKKLNQQFEYGGSVTQKINKYVLTWEHRCYSDGLPDELPKKVQDSMRAPSYKAIAMCILRNDHLLKGLGFSEKQSNLWTAFRNNEQAEKQQYDLFGEAS